MCKFCTYHSVWRIGWQELRRIEKLETRMDAVETDIKQIKGGMNFLVKQLSAPQPDPPRRRIGFGAKEDDKPTRPYGRAGASHLD